MRKVGNFSQGDRWKKQLLAHHLPFRGQHSSSFHVLIFSVVRGCNPEKKKKKRLHFLRPARACQAPRRFSRVRGHLPGHPKISLHLQGAKTGILRENHQVCFRERKFFFFGSPHKSASHLLWRVDKSVITKVASLRLVAKRTGHGEHEERARGTRQGYRVTTRARALLKRRKPAREPLYPRPVEHKFAAGGSHFSFLEEHFVLGPRP